MQITAVYQNSVFKPRELLELPEGTEVQLTVSAASASAASPSVESTVDADLDRLASLAPDWDGYGAPPLDRAILEAARRFISQVPWQPAGRPLVVPLSSGALQFEWHQGEKILELEIEDPATIHFLKWHPPSGIKDEDVFPIDDLTKASNLIRWFESTAHA
jgi:predicted DNA-binding antitoxin AbrB/MazE fold protein